MENNPTAMRIGSTQWKTTLIEGAARLGVSVDERQADQMAVHGMELLDWNRRINLTAISDPLEVAVKHFIDSLAGSKAIPKGGRLLDLGSGGGFPGLPLKIIRPAQPMTLVDGVRKKISFIKHIIRTLQLTDIEAIHLRAEDMEKNHVFDVVTSRAVTDLEAMGRLAAPLLSPEGVLVVYKGPLQSVNASLSSRDSTDIPQTPSSIPGFSATFHDYSLPFLGDARRLVVMRRVD